jgi:hypothetical protein
VENLACDENEPDDMISSKELETVMYLDQYIAFLKQISLQLLDYNKHLFFNSADKKRKIFPLLQMAMLHSINSDAMIKTSTKTIIL